MAKKKVTLKYMGVNRGCGSQRVKYGLLIFALLFNIPAYPLLSDISFENVFHILIAGYFLDIYNEPFSPAEHSETYYDVLMTGANLGDSSIEYAYPNCIQRVNLSDSEDLMKKLESSSICQLELKGVYLIDYSIEITKPLISPSNATCDLSMKYGLDQSQKQIVMDPEIGLFVLEPTLYPQNYCPSAVLIFDEGNHLSRALVKARGSLNNVGIVGQQGRLAFEFDSKEPVSVVSALSVPKTTALTVYAAEPEIMILSGRKGKGFGMPTGKTKGGQRRAAEIKTGGSGSRGSATDAALLMYEKPLEASASGGAGDDDPKKPDKLEAKFLAYTKDKSEKNLEEFVAAFNGATYNEQKALNSKYCKNRNFKNITRMNILKPKKGITLGQ